MKKNLLEKYYGTDQAAKSIYGIILIFVYIITQSAGEGDAPASLALGTFLAAVAIVLAEIYSEIIGKTIKQKHKLTSKQRIEIEKDSLAIIGVSLWPALFFLLSSFGLYSSNIAFYLSYTYCIVTLFAFSYLAGRLSGFTKYGSLLNGVVTSIIGLAVVIAKYTLDH